MLNIMKFSSFLLLSGATTSVTGFTTQRMPTTRTLQHVRPLQVFSPEYLTDISNALAQHSDWLPSQLLSDAAAAAAQDDGGWWQSYLNIFKNTLLGVHSIIDQPLKNIGVEQTWGISIAIFTAMCRSLLIPLSLQQTKSAEYMKVLKPYVAEIKLKFKNNQSAQNQAVAKLYEDANQNPLAGCLTSIVQLPIFLGLYRGVRLLALDGEISEPFLWIPSLEGPVSPPDYRGLDWLTQNWEAAVGGGLPTPSLGWETTIAYLIMPVVLVTLQSVTMRALQPPVDENMSDDEKETLEKSQTVLKFLPLMIGFFSLQVPAGLTIYWFTSNIFTLTQSLAVKAYFKANPPKINLPDYWETALADDKDFDSMTPEERRAAAEAGIQLGPTMDNLIEEARFHAFIERTPLRTDSEAWVKVTSADGKVTIPEELKEWVAAGAKVNGASYSSPEETEKAFFVERK
ncbi:hypothetical protein MPSEU_000694300 [Mayamaea pseudoterrestris]|nr:hypothetical protein MPSEU_000694300 [Mayamaea pseudoterrestris]